MGRFARDQGGKVPGRLVSSAKSWLCHPGVDRTAPLLPWGAPPDALKVSPLEASAKYLKHLADAWNHAPGRSPDDRLEDQPVTLTVPASFDDTARTLTAEAARLAGLKHVTLLEEPQAAFYAWLGTHTPAEAGRLKPGMRCLVVDVGGGTTDLSLIKVGEEQGDLTFVREAVGDHLLLGGDNMDLALARYAGGQVRGQGQARCRAGSALLVQSCRASQRSAAGRQSRRPSTPDHGHGSRPLGPRRDHAHVLGDRQRGRRACHPRVAFSAAAGLPSDGEAPKASRTALQEMGLPYVADPAITSPSEGVSGSAARSRARA